MHNPQELLENDHNMVEGQFHDDVAVLRANMETLMNMYVKFEDKLKTNAVIPVDAQNTFTGLEIAVNTGLADTQTLMEFDANNPQFVFDPNDPFLNKTKAALRICQLFNNEWINEHQQFNKIYLESCIEMSRNALENALAID